jgi:membrane fusion protein (multidrug efflux system)
VLLEDGSEYAHPAKLLFADLQVDATSGQVLLRAELPNPKGDLLPGLYVKVRLDQGRSSGAMLVPQQAVTRGAAGDTVMVVGADKQVASRTVQLGGTQNANWVVLGGLKQGEQVVVDGFQKIRPKTPVTPVPWSPLGAASAASAPAAASAAAPAASR